MGTVYLINIKVFLLSVFITFSFALDSVYAEDEAYTTYSDRAWEESRDSKSQQEEIKQSEINKKLNISEPIFANNLLANQFGVYLKNTSMLATKFSMFNNFLAFLHINEIPKTRAEKVGHRDDLLHQRGIQIQINRGHINSETLILSDTGHDIPMSVQLLKNSFLNAQTFFYIPEQILNSSGNNDRLLSQSQSWAEDRYHYQNKQDSSLPGAIFIGLEGHRREYDGSFTYEIPWRDLPTTAELIKLGIKQVVYITEKHPNNLSVKDAVLIDIQSYLKTIDLPIKYVGVDCRRDEGC